MNQQYIGFRLGGSEMSVPIQCVQEIMKAPVITVIPQTLQYIEGVANIRGKVISIINLSTFMGKTGGPVENQKMIILSRGHSMIGVLVDEITGVVTVDSTDIEDPTSVMPEGNGMIVGIAKMNGSLNSIINPDKLLLADNDASVAGDDIINVSQITDGKVEITKEVNTIGGMVNVKEIVDAKEFFEKRRMDSGANPQLYDNMHAFLEAVESGDFVKVEALMQQMGQAGADGQLFKEVGRVTRKLHDSIKNFREALDPKIKDMALDGMPSAVDGLHLVIEKTEESATKTLGIVENTLFEVDDASAALRNIETALKGGCATDIAVLRKINSHVYDGMSEILIGQSFQDLTGQTIKRVIKLIGELESELVYLVSNFSVKGDTDKISVTSQVKTHEQLQQEDVDSLLANLGF